MNYVSIVTPTYNEEENVLELYSRVTATMSKLKVKYEIIFIDNASTDNTAKIIKGLAKADSRVKLIVNATNFGHIRSPYHAILQARGDAVILIASDLQDPPEMLETFISEWQSGKKIVLAVKASSDESFFWRNLRKSYYKFIERVSSTTVVKNATGAGIFDKKVIEELRKLNDPYPYFRGLIVELGFKVHTIEFHQPLRKGGKTKNNLLTLIDIAILGLTTQSKAPIRLISLFGLAIAILSLAVAVVYALAKILFWDSFQLGLAPLIIGVFFFGSIQIFLIGLLGEYLANIQRRLRNLPLVIEDERVNF